MTSSHHRATFHWDDPMLLDRQLSDDERQVRDAAAAYAQKRLAPRVLEAFRNERTDPELLTRGGASLGVSLRYLTIPTPPLGCSNTDFGFETRLPHSFSPLRCIPDSVFD